MADNQITNTNPNDYSTTSKSEPTPPPELMVMVQRIKTGCTVDESRWTESNSNMLLSTLNSLWMEAKGNGI